MQHAIDEILAGRKISEVHLESLEKSFLEHPYSSSLAILLAKAYSLNDDIRFEEHIRKTAILTNNRKHLHDFLFASTSETEGRKEVDAPKSGDAAQHDQIEAEIEAPEKVEEEKAQESAPIDHDDDPLLKQFNTEAINAGAVLDLLAEEAEPIKTEEPTTTGKSEVVSKKEEIDEREKPSEKVEAPSKQSFSLWMNYLSDGEKKVLETPEEKNPLQTVFPRDEEEKKKVISIIDNFIEKEDSLVPKRAEFFNPSKAAKASLEDNESLVTETLASIYAAQGNINKAISTYNKLSLLHPEKSSYFAALIEKLKSEKKDNKS